MPERDLHGPAGLRPPWRRAADAVIVAAFVVLLTMAVTGPLAGLARPGHTEFFAAERSAANFSAAGMDQRLFFWLRLVSTSLAGLVLAGAAALLFRQHRRQSVAAVLSFSFLVLSITIYGVQLLGVPQLFRLASFVPAAWSLFTIALMIFPDGRFVPSWLRWPALLLVVLTPLGIARLLPIPFGPLGVGFLLLAVGALLLRYRRLAAGTERQQIRWALLGFAAGAPLTILTVSIQSFIGGDVSPVVWVWGDVLIFTVLLPLSHLLIAGGVVVSLLKYRLYDADAVIARSVSYGALTVVLLALFAGAETVIELLSEEFFGASLGVLAGGLGAAFAALMIVPLHGRLAGWAERRFQKELLALRTGLPALVGDLRETAPVERIAAATLDWVVQGVRASRAALLVDGGVLETRGVARDAVEGWRAAWLPPAGSGLQVDRDDPLFPARVPLEADGHGRVGWLLLGPRPDGSFYGSDERAALADIADPVARALEIAGLRRAREAADRSHWQGQQQLNARLLRTLESIDAKLEQVVAPLPAVVKFPL
jgi:hypothetical protein